MIVEGSVGGSYSCILWEIWQIGGCTCLFIFGPLSFYVALVFYFLHHSCVKWIIIIIFAVTLLMTVDHLCFQTLPAPSCLWKCPCIWMVTLCMAGHPQQLPSSIVFVFCHWVSDDHEIATYIWITPNSRDISYYCYPSWQTCVQGAGVYFTLSSV